MSEHEQPTILYVDDDQTNRNLFTRILRSAGYAVQEAASGNEALHLVDEHPDLVILDVNLPDVNGFEVCRRIKGHPATRSIPVLHMSAVFVRSEDRTQGLEGGADGYLIKPVEPGEVLATVKALLRVREAEEAARTAAREWQTTFDALSDAVCLLDCEGQVVRGNRALAGLLGRPIEEIVGRPCHLLCRAALGSLSCMHRNEESSAEATGPLLEETTWQELFARVCRSRQRETLELVAGERWFLTTADPVIDEQGEVTGSVHLFADITEQKQMEAEHTQLLGERAELAQSLQLLLESTEEGIFGLDQEGRCTFINRAGARQLGYSPEEMIGQSLHALIHHSRADGTPYQELECPMTQTLLSGRGCRVDSEVFWRRDGTCFPVEYSCHPLQAERKKEEGGRRKEAREGFPSSSFILHPSSFRAGAVVTFRDISERKRLEEQVRQAQKMEAVGRLAGGVAHDFNNLLTAITGNTSLLLVGKPPGDPDREQLQVIDRAAWRAAELVRQLLGFSRRTMLWLQPTNVNSCIEEVVAILGRTIDPRIHVEVHPAPDLWPVQADPGQLNQVLMNLCLNARDAMPQGGRLFLETANVLLDAEAARAFVEARPGEFVRLRVADTGQGIPADIQPRIFDPYFTTKEPGKGTGLGLAMVFGIVQLHKGWINCSSIPEQGTCFDLYLPRLARPEETPPPPPPPPPPPRGKETILLVDDEPLLRHLARMILQSYGYQVLLAEDGRQALELYRREGQHIDLVILDLTMPRLSGRDTLRALRALNPRVPVILASGYASEQNLEPELGTVQGFIGKPYREQDLAQVVRQVLDRTTA